MESTGLGPPCFNERVAYKTVILLLAFALLELVAAEIGGLFTERVTPPHEFALGLATYEPMITAGVLGIYCCYLAIRPPRRELAVVSLLGFILEFALDDYRHIVRSGLFRRLLNFGAGLGLAAVLGLLFRAWRTGGVERSRALHYLAMGLTLPALRVFGVSFLALNADLTPQVYDVYAYHYDFTYGTSFPFVVAGFLTRHPWLMAVADTTYKFLGLWIVLAVVAHLRAPRGTYNNIVAASFLVGMIGTTLYNVFPVVGLVVLFGPARYPLELPIPAPSGVLQLVNADPMFHRDGMPSLHTAWILAAYVACYRTSRKAAWIGAGLVVITELSTFLVGHYLMDLFVAVPLVLCIQGLTAWRLACNRRERWAAILAGAGMTLGSIAVMRWYPALVLGVGMLGPSLVMVGASLYLERRLYQATERGLSEVPREGRSEPATAHLDSSEPAGSSAGHPAERGSGEEPRPR